MKAQNNNSLGKGLRSTALSARKQDPNGTRCGVTPKKAQSEAACHNRGISCILGMGSRSPRSGYPRINLGVRGQSPRNCANRNLAITSLDILWLDDTTQCQLKQKTRSKLLINKPKNPQKCHSQS